MIERIPITSAEQLNMLDTDEIVEGYLDGRNNEPCGNNRSTSFWHGWRNGRVDGGHAQKDNAQSMLAHDVLIKGKML